MTPPIEGSARKTLAAGMLFLLLAGLGWLMLRHSQGLYATAPMRGDPGPFFLITLCLGVIGAAGALLAALGLWALARAPAPRPATAGLAATARARALSGALSGAFVASLIAMPSAMQALGTTPAVALFATGWIYALLAALRGHSLRHAAEALAFGLATAAVIDLMFLRLLTLPLPT